MRDFLNAILIVGALVFSQGSSRIFASETPALVPRVVLLSSLDFGPYSKLSISGEFYANYITNLESIFRRQFMLSGLNVDVETISNADADTVHRELTSGRNVAVYFVGHSFAAKGAENSIIWDYGFRDIKKAFNSIHPNVRFLGMIFCNSNSIIRRLREEEGYFSSKANLKVFGFDAKIEARSSLAKSIQESIPVLLDAKTKSSRDSNQFTSRGFPITITRKLPSHFEGTIAGSVTVSVGNTLITSFSTASPGETQTKAAWIPVSALTEDADLTLSVSSGTQPYFRKTKIEIGEIIISNHPWPGASWELFRRTDGTPAGTSEYSFDFVGQLPDLNKAQFFGPYDCVPLETVRKFDSSSPYPF